MNVVGITATYHTFNFCFAFLSSEKVELYIWALQQIHQLVLPKVICTDRELALMNAIHVVFPGAKNLLCIWHIQKNVLANCKKDFDQETFNLFMSSWTNVVYSKSEVEWERNYEKFKTDFSSFPNSLNYIERQWIPYKEKFISCFVNCYSHFGSTSTSRVEGNHHLLKEYVRLGNLDLLSVLNKLELMLANQRVELTKNIERDKLRVVLKFKLNIFMLLLKNISIYALEKIYDQYVKAVEIEKSEDDSICTQMFSKTYGLPCKHTILRLIKAEEPIAIDLIHLQWRLHENVQVFPSPIVSFVAVSPIKSLLNNLEMQMRDEHQSSCASLFSRAQSLSETPFTVIQGPQVVKSKRGRPSGAKNKNKTTRDKSHFEYVEGRKCKSCGESGHNSRTCSKNK